MISILSKDTLVHKQAQIGALEVVIFNREMNGRFPNHPIGFMKIQHTPKAKYSSYKVLENYVYKTIEEAIARFNQFVTNMEQRVKEKQAKKQANALVQAADFYQVGDIVYNSWGYEQTNIDFYQVVEVKPKTIVIKAIYQKQIEGSMMSHGMACDVTAVKDSFIEGGKKYNLRVKAEGYLSSPESYYSFSKWDGRELYKSWYY